MFEITYKDEETLQSYVDCHKAYPGAVYDFTFEHRFIIYHAEVAHALHYVTLDMKPGTDPSCVHAGSGIPLKSRISVQ